MPSVQPLPASQSPPRPQPQAEELTHCPAPRDANPQGMKPTNLADLENDVRRDLELIAHPRKAWLRPRSVDGASALDVLIIGAGQGGLAVGCGLLRDRVENILLVDRTPYGQEGPWVTYARMPTLRSAKDQTGPDLNVPSLTYQAWHEAQWGTTDWQAMPLTPSGKWNDYLLWFRRVVGLRVRNDEAVTAIAPCRTDDDLPCLAATTGTGEVLYARKIVLATGQDGTGQWWMPDFIASLPPAFRAHAADAIDFTALAGRTVAVLVRVPRPSTTPPWRWNTAPPRCICSAAGPNQ